MFGAFQEAILTKHSIMDNIIASRLYHAGYVGYVSNSGGMLNELNNIFSLVTNGTYKGIAIGGDCYPGTTFIDHLLRYEDSLACNGRACPPPHCQTTTSREAPILYVPSYRYSSRAFTPRV